MPKLRVTILHCKDLEAKDIGGSSDPFVKITIASIKVKTDVIKKNCNPVWNSVFNLELPITCNPSVENILFEVYDYDRFTANDLIGKASTSLGTLYRGKSHQFTMTLQNSKRGTLTVELLAEDFGTVLPTTSNNTTTLPKSSQPIQTQPMQTPMQGYPQQPPMQGYPQQPMQGYPQQPQMQGHPQYYPPQSNMPGHGYVHPQQPMQGYPQQYPQQPMYPPQQGYPQQQTVIPPYPVNPLVASTTTTTTTFLPPHSMN